MALINVSINGTNQLKCKRKSVRELAAKKVFFTNFSLSAADKIENKITVENWSLGD